MGLNRRVFLAGFGAAAGVPLVHAQAKAEECKGHRAVRMGDWKLVSRLGARWELCRMDEDRGELNDLSARAMHARWADRCGVVEWDKLPKARV